MTKERREELKDQLAKEWCDALAMPQADRLRKYGTHGLRLLMQRYLDLFED